MVMKPNLSPAPAVWHDFYDVTGFAPGTEVIGCNSNNGTRVYLFEGDRPNANVTAQGWEIPPGGGFKVKSEAGQAWVRGNAPFTLCGLQEFVE